LAESDYVMLCCPLSDETRGLINAKTLARMKPTSILVNIARGPVVDTQALYEALVAKRIAAAGLDVTDPEPLPPDHPLWTTRSCFITPHTAGGRHDQDEALVDHFLTNLANFEGGEPLVDRVV